MVLPHGTSRLESPALYDVASYLYISCRKCTGKHFRGCNFPADTGDKVLDLCQRNIERNLSELDVTGNVFVRELEWTKPYQSSSRYPTLLIW